MGEFYDPVKGENMNAAKVKEKNPIVATTHGRVLGENRNGVAVFRGIPYGADCGKKRRFLPPLPAENWEEIRDCTHNGHIAMQYGGSISAVPYWNGGHPEKFKLEEEVQGEDCLVLNVLTPGIDAEKRPVLVYIHGGGFLNGSGSLVLGADDLVREQDLVLVGVNHRLTIFGYLYLGHLDAAYASSGMAGILDLLLALEWVRDNIAAFGGDPDRVTIMGESGGAMKVSNLLDIPQARGLFRSTVIESGSCPTGTYQSYSDRADGKIQMMFGQCRPFSPELLKTMYGSLAGYRAKAAASTDNAISHGWILPEDREFMIDSVCAIAKSRGLE